MAGNTSRTKPRRLAQGQRKHVRRLKAATRKAGTAPGYATRSSILEDFFIVTARSVLCDEAVSE